MIKFNVCRFYHHIRNFSSWDFIYLSSCSADIGFLTSFPGHPPNFKSSSSIFHCPCSLSVSSPLSRGHFESPLLPFRLFPALSPLSSQWESCALYSFWAPNWCFSIFCTLTLLYTNITELNLSKHLPTSWLWSFHLNHIIFYLLIYFIFYSIYLFTDH